MRTFKLLIVAAVETGLLFLALLGPPASAEARADLPSTKTARYDIRSDGTSLLLVPEGGLGGSGPSFTLFDETTARDWERSVAGGAGPDARPRVDASAGAPLPANQYLNLSFATSGLTSANPILVVLFLKTSNPVRGDAAVRVELLAGEQRILVYDFLNVVLGPQPRSLASGGGTATAAIPAQRLLPGGAKPVLRLTLLSASTDVLIGTDAAAQSYVEYRYFDYDPLSLPLSIEEGVLSAGQPGPSTPADSGEAVDASGFLWPIVPLAVAGGRQARGRTCRTAIEVLALLLLAGCTSKGVNPSSESESATSPSANVSVERVDDPNLTAVDRAMVQGFVRDADRSNLSLKEANVFLEGTNSAAKTNGQGFYQIRNVTPHPRHVVVVDAGHGFPLVRFPIDIQARLYWVNFSISRRVEGCGACVPHVHPSWGPEGVETLFQGPVLFGNGKGIVPIEPPKLVYPGAVRMEVSFTWEAGPLTPQELRLRFLPAFSQVPATPLPARVSGDVIGIAFFPNWADPGHAEKTRWGLTIESAPRPHAAAMASGADAQRGQSARDLSVDVLVRVFRGIIPLEPPHENPWAQAPRLVLIHPGDVYPANVGAVGPQFYVSEGPTAVPEWNDGAFRERLTIPQGTKQIVGFLNWTYAPAFQPALHENWRLFYQNGVKGEWTAATVVASPAENVTQFRIEVSPEEQDAFYSKTRTWTFGYDLDDDSDVAVTQDHTPPGEDVHLQLSASLVRDPEFKI